MSDVTVTFSLSDFAKAMCDKLEDHLLFTTMVYLEEDGMEAMRTMFRRVPESSREEVLRMFYDEVAHREIPLTEELPLEVTIQ